MVNYQKWLLEDLHDGLLSPFIRYQETNQVLVAHNNQLMVKDDSFIDDWNHAKKLSVIKALRTSIERGGIGIGVYDEKELIAFACIESYLFGSKEQYVELSYLHVSLTWRRSGIGKELFEICCKEAKGLGATHLYIAAHPSVETQRFYQSVGCKLASEINALILAKEPLDIQMERLLESKLMNI